MPLYLNSANVSHHDLRFTSRRMRVNSKFKDGPTRLRSPLDTPPPFSFNESPAFFPR